MNAPKYTIRQRVKVGGYTGILASDYTISPAHHQFEAQVEGIRLIPEVGEEWVQTGVGEEEGHNQRTVEYPKGWEYLVVSLQGAVWGWIQEKVLMEKGY